MANLSKLKQIEIIPVEGNIGFWIADFNGSASIFSNESKNGNFLDGFRKIKDTFWNSHKISLQIFKQSVIFSEEQLKFIIHHIIATFSQKSNISKNPANEFLLYLAQRRQITHSIEQAGIIPPSKSSSIISFGIILFGEISELKKVVNHLLDNLPNFSSSIKPFSYLSKEKLGGIIKEYNISPDLLQSSLQNHNLQFVDSSGNREHLTENNYLDLIQSRKISESQFRSILAEIFNLGLVKLFIENFRSNHQKKQE
ncbi:MAG: KEOPS complex subunit Cgi121 [Promethearchaeota archaeon]